jgi:ABC-type nitrate/sulfonate/bicarbonate transport system permease component
MRVVTAGWKDSAAIAEAAGFSVQETVFGLGLGIVVAFAFALAIESFKAIRRSAYPLLVASQTVPIVAVAPLLVLWFGFGQMPKVLLVAVYTFFPLVVGLVGGMAATPREQVDLMRTIGVSNWRVLLTVQLPNAMPQFFTGLRIASSYALGTAVIAEFLGSFDGLGIYLIGAKASFRTDLVFAAAVVIVVLTLALFALVVFVERLAMPWRRYERRQS